MERVDVIPAIVLSSHALARIAAQEAGNDAPSAQWRVLSILEQRDGMRLGALARASRTTQPGMTRLVGDLERSGLVTRGPDASDSRAIRVTLTDIGRRTLHAWRAEFRDTLAPLFADLDDSQWDALRSAAEILAAHTREESTGENA
ncbi:MarR family winged helix-turn-helix transcriptional regulator [Microbacterium sp. NPDC058345]|uniref:MarR family winged helix-turn-helix transcriptional regulator n=1 Tax=Microbacterium sp. NPDC058345 TaxID=3346455 RepID=UPI00365FEA82